MIARTILIIEDDEILRKTLVEQISIYNEFDILEADSAICGLEFAEKNNVDLIIMDIGLPDMDGRKAITLLREKEFRAPIILLTGHDSETDTVLGLESGANDYVTKPFKFSVLLARIRAQLRHFEQSDNVTFPIGNATFHPYSKTLVGKGGRIIRLTEKESSILKLLLRSDDHSVSRKDLLEKVWGYHAGVETHTLETHMYRLRQKIEPDPGHKQLLKAIPGGYKLFL